MYFLYGLKTHKLPHVFTKEDNPRSLWVSFTSHLSKRHKQKRISFSFGFRTWMGMEFSFHFRKRRPLHCLLNFFDRFFCRYDSLSDLAMGRLQR